MESIPFNSWPPPLPTLFGLLERKREGGGGTIDGGRYITSIE